MTTQSASHSLSRRSLLSRGAAIAGGGALLSLFGGRLAAAAPLAQRGGGGALKVLMWQGPTILNPHLAQGTKDFIAARFCCEPLLTVSADGQFTPVLAAQVPSVDNGGLLPDGKTVVYTLKSGIVWADGQPFTSDDVVFTYQFIADTRTAATTLGTYADLDSVDAIDPLTVRLTFKAPTGGWYVPFAGSNGMVLPKHALQNYTGTAARDAPFNLKCFGTGPYMAQEFKPGDALALVINPNYRDATKPYFDEIDIKGGGDAVSAARAVLQTGEYDYAWNLQVEAQVLNGLLQGGRGDLVTGPGGGVEQILFNQADPNLETDGERSNAHNPHPFLTDMRVRHAMALAIDRTQMAGFLYGPSGGPATNLLTTPTSLSSPNTTLEYDPQQANDILDQAGYPRGPDGVRVGPDGTRMHVVYQTSINSLRQKEQDMVKQGWESIGIETELKSVDASVYFSSDVGNPDTASKFYTDVEMFTSTFDSPFPLAYMKRYYGKSPEVDWAQKSNNWSAPNYMKWSDDQYNTIYDQVKSVTDMQKANQMWIQLNDIVVGAYAVIPLIDRKSTDAKIKSLQGPSLSAFDNWSWNIADWTRG